MNHAPFLASVLVLSTSIAAGCGGRGHPSRVATGAAPEGMLCRIAGTWSFGELRTEGSGVVFAEAWDAHAEAVLARSEGALRLHVVLARDGFQLEGRLDADRDEALHVRTMTPLADGVWLAPGTPTHLVEARPTPARSGEVLIGLSRFSFGADEAVHFPMPPRRWVPCDDLSFASAPRSDETYAAERVAIGLPASGPQGTLAAGTAVDVRLVPGGAVIATLGPDDHARTVDVLETQGASTRVLLHAWTGAMLVGWIETSALGPVESGGGGGLFGALAGPETLDVCIAQREVELFASHDGGSERIGRVDAGTRLVRVAQDAGGVTVEPHPSQGVRAAEGATWRVPSDAPLVCQQEIHDPSAALGGLGLGGLGVLGRRLVDGTLEVTASVTAVTGLSGVAVGATCEATIDHFAGPGFGCRAVVRCGGRVVFGERDSNGFFTCAFVAGATPSVSGHDDQTSTASGDATLALDTVAGTLALTDDATGTLGAFSVEARVTSVRDVSPRDVTPPDAE